MSSPTPDPTCLAALSFPDSATLSNPAQGGVFTAGPHLVDDQLPFEDGHEVVWLLPHDHPDLHGSPAKLLIHLHRLVGRGCQLSLGSVAALQVVRGVRGLGPVAREASGSNTQSLCLAYLPDVQDVMGLPVHMVCVQNQIAVSSVEEAVPLVLHGDQLQVLNPPDLATEETRFPRGSPCSP